MLSPTVYVIDRDDKIITVNDQFWIFAAQNQSALNPEISFISDVRARVGDATADDLDLVFEELEIGAQANLNPWARGDLFLGLHDGEIEVDGVDDPRALFGATRDFVVDGLAAR